MQRFISSRKTLLAKLRSTQTQYTAKSRKGFGRSLRMETLECRQMLSVTVNTHIDQNDLNISGPVVSLRDAILFGPANETINFDSSLNGQTISLDPSLGEIAFSKSLTIDASELSNGITISATTANSMLDPNDGIRIFDITDATGGTDPPVVTLNNLKLTGGDVFVRGEDGGAIRSHGDLILDHCEIYGNSAFSGGGVDLEASGSGTTARNVLTIENGTNIHDNTSGADGGGGINLNADGSQITGGTTATIMDYHTDGNV